MYILSNEITHTYVHERTSANKKQVCVPHSEGEGCEEHATKSIKIIPPESERAT